jgi:sugar/nucleoside kinase (ribokinase family)
VSYWDWDALQRLEYLAGFPASRRPVMAAISLAESSGDSTIVSPAGAIGLWQIMPFWAATFHQPVSDLYVALINCDDARRISGNGYNLGAWDTCYNPPSSAAVRRDLHWPETGSPAWNILQTHGAGINPGETHGAAGSADPGDRQLMQQVGWANHLQDNAIPHNTGWVAYNRSFHNIRPSVRIV